MTNFECKNKISDDEIISSLKVISTTRNCDECKIRNCKWGDCNCSQIAANAALDLINRQNAEIKRLNLANDEKFHQWDILAEKTKQHYADLYNEAKDILKSEAYKKFAARLKSYLLLNKKGEMSVVSFENVDSLLKEMIDE